jgi:Mn2+/Fe2+ NRAMP family transporter
MKPLVDLATSIAFVAAPVFAFMNMKLVFRKDFPSEAKAGWAFRALAFLGFTFLTAFAILYAYTLITTR